MVHFTPFRSLLMAAYLLELSLVNAIKYYQVGKANATFYGGPQGVGGGGACGYENLTAAGYGSRVAAVSAPFFKNGLGCGSCFSVRCVNSKYCTGKSVVVPTTDFCPGDGGFCCPTCTHFDLSQPSFRAIADVKAGHIPVQYYRVPCPNSGSIRLIVTGNTYWMNIMVQNVAGPGEIRQLELSKDGGKKFLPMLHSWGANWVYSFGLPSVPLRFRFTSGIDSQVVVTSQGCLKANWRAGTYYCGVQFKGPKHGAPPPPRKRVKNPPGRGRHPPGKGRHPPGRGRRHPPGKGRHPPGKGHHK